MGCSQSQRLEINQALTLVGGATASIFPQAEALIIGSNGYWEALQYVAARKKMSRYQSVIDFLFCELHPEWKMACRRYYNHNGPPLREQITVRQLAIFNARLLIALEVALECHKEKQRKSWGCYRDRVETALKAA